MINGISKQKIFVQSILLLTLVVFTLGICYYFGSNQIDILNSINVHYVQEPGFSVNSGFYETPFLLHINVPDNTKVYYTLDCSDPGVESIVYEEPIYLDDATNHENNFCMNKDVSTGFYVDLIKQIEGPEKFDGKSKYNTPDYNIEKCNVVRAVAVDAEGNYSKTVTKVFFVGIPSSYYDDCNIVSIVTDPINLFDENSGIYVTGKTFSEYLESGELQREKQKWYTWNANYRQRGREWERGSQITLLDKSGEIKVEKDIGIRIQGGVSRGFLPKSLNIYSRKKYDNKEFFEYEFFSDGFLPASINLASGGNQVITQFNDYMMSNRVNKLHIATMKFEPCVLFLDGEYWGFYWMNNRYDSAHISHYYQVNSNDILMIKNGTINIGDERFFKLYKSMYSTITESDMTDADNYEKACEIIDIDSFIDYYATQIYIARSVDWPSSNYALWRTVTPIDNSSYADGKWRWMLFDSNSDSMSADCLYDNSLEYVIEQDKLFSSMWKNEEFKQAFQNRILEIADTCFNSLEMAEFIDNYSKKMYPIMEKSWMRFYGSQNDKGTVYKNQMESYKAFFRGRKKVVESWFE